MSLPTTIKLLDGRTATLLSTYASNAIKQIKDDKDGIQTYLKCRYPSLNAIFSKGLRFKSITGLCGTSGGGKSYLLNILLNDFTDTVLNREFTDKTAAIWYGYENSGVDELIRIATHKLKLSYEYICSSELNRTDNKVDYNVLTNEEFDTVCKFINSFNKPIYHVSMPSTIGNTYASSVHLFKNELKGYKPIVAIDHTGLSSRGKDEKFELDISTNTAISAIKLKNFGAMVILLIQMNDEIEQPARIKEGSPMNKPRKKDSFGGKILYQSTDNFIFIHKPAKIGISKYLKERYNTSIYINEILINTYPNKFITADLGKELQVIHVYADKKRKGGTNTSEAWFLDAFHRGTLIPISSNLLID